MLTWLITLGGFVLIILLGGVLLRGRERRLARGRKADTFDAFLNQFNTTAEKAVANLVYHRLQKAVSVEDFPVRPSDDLRVYGLSDDDIGDMIEELLSEGNYKLPAQEAMRAQPGVISVADLIRHLTWARENQPDR